MKKIAMLFLMSLMASGLYALDSEQHRDLDALLKVISHCNELKKNRYDRWMNTPTYGIGDKEAEKSAIEAEAEACRDAQIALKKLMKKIVNYYN